MEKNVTQSNVMYFSIHRLLIITSVGVITMCLAVMVVVLVCCFSSQCPLYTCTACPPNYQHDEAVAFSKTSSMLTLNFIMGQFKGD